MKYQERNRREEKSENIFMGTNTSIVCLHLEYCVQFQSFHFKSMSLKWKRFREWQHGQFRGMEQLLFREKQDTFTHCSSDQAFDFKRNLQIFLTYCTLFQIQDGLEAPELDFFWMKQNQMMFWNMPNAIQLPIGIQSTGPILCQLKEKSTLRMSGTL